MGTTSGIPVFSTLVPPTDTAAAVNVMAVRASGSLEGLQILRGNISMGVQGTGIDFNSGTGSAITSNLLDDYEEGTWTPTSTSFTFTNSGSSYTKIGNIVNLRASIIYTSGGTPAITGGLPFAASGNSAGTIEDLSLGGAFASSGDVRVSGAGIQIDNLTIAGNGQIVFSITYTTTA